MSEPRKLREEMGSQLEHALLQAGTSYRGSVDTKAKALAALGLAGVGAAAIATGAAGTAGAAGTTTLSSLGKVTVFKIVAALSLAGAVVAVPVTAGLWAGRHQAMSSAVSPPAAAAPARAAAIAAGPTTVPAVASGDGVARAMRPDGRPDARATTTANPGASLTRELAALDTARTALARGQAPSALAALDAYDRAFPRGRLELEAEVLRIDALARSGRGDAARAHAHAFVGRHPDSVLAARVRGYLGN